MNEPGAGRSQGPLGRPPVTTHAAIERAAFALFDEHGFDETTLDDIAEKVGVARRTLFHYYKSKNDILWGQFDQSLRTFADHFAAMPARMPLGRAIREAIIQFNRIEGAGTRQHRARMQFLLQTPALLAHSELRYRAWREVVADFVARREGCEPTSLRPVLAGRISLAMALTAYEQWLADDEADLVDLLDEATSGLVLLYP